ncbi:MULTISPECIES: protein NO VEIN domain-containing protein [unclassified Brevibacillus]|uniref:protein NO VEIN domain-containing protein n=1 Tax=unclassified Brevibacillus TaxID=2684853 RepID=UPI0035640025
MMTFSVGILYSSQKFLKFIKDNDLTSLDFPKMFQKFYIVADAKTVLETSLECKWVTLKENNHLKLTKRGEDILYYHEEYQRLRVQLAHLIETYKPSWAPLITFGRVEAVKFFSQEVKQCFNEAYLLDGYEKDVIEWWDKLALAARGFYDDVKLELGRKGEALSIQYEKERTGSAALWQSIESNFSGFDLLSQVNRYDMTPLRIEVKTTNSKHEIAFIITKGEWDVALKVSDYIFHIWSLNPQRELFIFKKKDMIKHMPVNHGNGQWESVKVTLTREEIYHYKV